jgi:hypothetical protein
MNLIQVVFKITLGPNTSTNNFNITIKEPTQVGLDHFGIKNYNM